MKNLQEYQEWSESFFSQYRQALNNDACFVDGIIDYELYRASNTKVLFVNREAYDEEGEWYDITETIRDKGMSHFSTNIRKRYSEYLPIFNMPKEDVISTSVSDIEQYVKSFNQDDINQMLQSTAYINVKKVNDGKSKSTVPDLRENFHKADVLLCEQIDVIAPDIILGGNVIEGIIECSEHIKWGDRLYFNGLVNVWEMFINDKKYIIFDMIHPAAISISKCNISEYYKEVFSAYKAIINKTL